MPINAPYNFVPLADKVVKPDWAPQVSHDLPFKDGLSGEVHYSLTAHSPLLVGGRQHADYGDASLVEFFKTPDGSCAIPGSSIHGMIRSVIEILSFSRMTQVDDTRWSVRDLTNPARPFYGNLMTQPISKHPPQYRAKPQSGWLRFDNGSWYLQPCRYSRVEHDDLAVLSRDHWWRRVGRVTARDKYNRWGSTPLQIHFTAGPVTLQPHHNKELEYSKATDLDLNTGKTQGTLVFTGQPAARNPGQSGRKHLEFIFHSPASSSIPVPDRVMEDFLHIHRPRKRDGYKGEEWSFWRTEPAIPVFYLTDSSGRIESLGLALMYKLAFRHSIMQAIAHTGNGSHLPGDELDLATLIFGHPGENEKTSAKGLKGRAWFDTALADPATVKVLPERTAALSAPKPTYFPNYVKQDTSGPAGDQLSGTSYATYSDPNCEIRGWKRYPARENPNPTPGGTDAVSSRLSPLDSGARFHGRLVFHNLKPAEAGALFWAMTWGGDEQLRHGLGMGKPLGYGQVSIDIENAKLDNNSVSRLTPSWQQCRDAFIDFMDGQLGGNDAWRQSQQIRSLLGMANPGLRHLGTSQVRYMTLNTENQNDFKTAKDNRWVLPEYHEHSHPPTGGELAEKRDQEIARQQAEAEEKARKEEADIRAKAERDEYEALPTEQKLLVDTRKAIDAYATLDDVERRQKQIRQRLNAALNKLTDQAQGWTGAERLRAADLLQETYENPAVGWHDPGIEKKKRHKQENKRRDAIARLRGSTK